MRQTFISAVLAVIVLVHFGSSLALGTPDQIDAHWLDGCWEHLDGSTREVWIDVGSGLLFGYAVTLRNGKLHAFEDLRIEPSATGATFVASPNGKNPVHFPKVAASHLSMTFENLDHDFPQRITYRREGETLTAEISTVEGTDAMQIEMRKCSD